MHTSANVVPFASPRPVKRRAKAKFSPADRDALIEAHMPQVRLIADRLAAKLPPSVERDDLISAGVLGLIDAVSKFDPARGVLFKTYAETRVRGAMLDSLRDLDWVPRSVRRRAREIDATNAKLQRRLGRAADKDEIAAELGISLGELHQRLGEVKSVTGFGDQEHDAWADCASRVADDMRLTPLAIYEREEMRLRLAAAVDRLPERERQVLALYYVEELTMKEIGAVLGVTESRVSQMRSEAVRGLRDALLAVAA
jgi:RNA polymerase sigma factor for flagellar operon FliA